METAAVSIEVLDEFFGGDVGVEGALVAEVTVPSSSTASLMNLAMVRSAASKDA